LVQGEAFAAQGSGQAAGMGQACAKGAPVTENTAAPKGGGDAASPDQNGTGSGGAPTTSNGDSSDGADGAEESEGGGKSKTFRARRLSVDQQAAKPQAGQQGRARRLSVYGGAGNADPGKELTSPVTSCGCKTQPGLEPVPGGAVSKINQDRALAIYPYHDDKATALFGVFDGHGRVGEQVSQYVIENLPGVLNENEHLDTNPGMAMREAFVNVDTTLADHVDASVSGTTAVACLIRGNHIWLANSGDSRAVIARQKSSKGNALKSVDLTRDHKPDCADEMRRILQMGGHVTPAGANGSPSRVWHNLRGLAMARSIGDHAAATVGVIADPEITEYDITDDDVALIVASDGVWELLSSQSVVDIVAGVKDLNPNEICDKIVEQSSYMWKVEEGDYRDDITVVVLTFPWLESYGDDDG